jgi:hypothetical protein
MKYAACKLMIAWVVLGLSHVDARGADLDLSRATWSTPSHEEVGQMVDEWLIEKDVPTGIAEQIRERWFEPVPLTRRVSQLVDSFALANQDIVRLMELCSAPKSRARLPEFDFLSSDDTLPFVRNNLKLYYAQWLAHNRLYDETLEQIASLQPGDVVDPAALLFYQGLAYHRLLKKEQCLPIIDRLLEQEESLPRRYATVARLVRADIEPLKEDSLDEVSRLMDSIQVRLDHGRAGKRVRTEEQDVIAKLDKLIKEMEDKAKSAAAAAQQGASDSKQSSNPMQDSLPGGGRGEGNIDAKDLGQKDGWGDLPAKERQQALQQLGKDFPSHYRDVIEEYFRKLAREGDEP